MEGWRAISTAASFTPRVWGTEAKEVGPKAVMGEARKELVGQYYALMEPVWWSPERKGTEWCLNGLWMLDVGCE